MIGAETNHCQVVAASLSKERHADEQTLASAAILNDRLQRVRELGPMFAGITFSPQVRQLTKTKAAAAVM